ncbi:MarR family transcriptional regulator [Mesorhizobium sp. NBSH29]|uniref:MarR family winged helix-turn-helix transcriptional regulator n=1 Tax=Mesorhizobium sp. NBSH29 TaxID=2654249 RepID=UPI0018968882|nr:MarR family transcriptional regulator [Mesorhizobium sp. NBSH29]QPC87745.1 MarR family transcriptional regulator [Mesorhizobium sp. NBSH29]
MFDGCIYFNTQALGRRLERIWTEAFRPFGLTPSQAFMLRAVLAEPAMLQGELADTLKIARATATRGVDGLEAKGLVTRHATKTDGRECEIQPTVAGRALQDGLNLASGAVTQRLKRQLGDDPFMEFVTRARGIADAVE